MIVRPITYETVDGRTITETFYFNLTKIEVIRLEAEVGENLTEFFQKIGKSDDPKFVISEFEKFIMLTYGEKSEDGRSHIKTDEVRERFRHTEAYKQLAWELGTNADSAAEFVNGVIPQISEEEIKTIEASLEKMKEMEKTAAAKTLPDPLLQASPFPPPPAPPSTFELPPEPA